jgi:protein-S-isoprenylcysteine O-methyltransferase Ste14
MLLLLKNLLFTIVVPGTVAGYLPLAIAGGRPPAAGPVFASGCAVLGLGAAVYVWCVWDFAVFGRGTPAPLDAPKRLVVRGLYRYTRNPMYVGVLTAILGWAVVYRSPGMLLYAAAVGLCFQGFIVLYEEPHLERLFGREYQDYRARVGRWLPRPGRPR